MAVRLFSGDKEYNMCRQVLRALKRNHSHVVPLDQLAGLAQEEDLNSDPQIFALSIEEVADGFFLDEEISNFENIDVLDITDVNRLKFMREVLRARSENLETDKTIKEVFWVKFKFPDDALFLLCGLGTYGSAGLSVEWKGTYVTLKAYLLQLKSEGYVTSIDDVEEFTDRELMSFWQDEQSPSIELDSAAKNLPATISNKKSHGFEDLQELELKEFLTLTGKNMHSLAVELALSAPKVHYWLHNCVTKVIFDKEYKVRTIILVREKIVYEA